MTPRKRHWFNKIYHDSQELNSQVNISWSTSESDSDEEIIPKKKLKHVTVKSKVCQNDKEYSDSVEQENHDKLKVSLNIVTGSKSPVLNQRITEGKSPLLINTVNSNESPNGSPIIAKTNTFKEVRSKYKQGIGAKKSVFNSPTSSPDIFQSEYTQLIDTELSSVLQDLEETKVSPTISLQAQDDLFEPSKIIDDFPSQTSSQVVNYASTNSDLYKTDTSDTLYHFPIQRKKRYKKGGLAFLLQKTLRLQKTRLSIWQHEIYKNKADTFTGFLNENIVIFRVNTVNTEYGIVLLECSTKINDSENHCILKPILILIGPIININFVVGKEYKLFSPYRCQNRSYKSKEVCCYFNVSKILCVDGE